MARIFQEFFQVNLVRTERGVGFRFRHIDGSKKRSLGTHHAHAPTAAAGACFDEDGVTDFAGNAKNFLGIVGQSAVATGHAGNTCVDHRLFGVDFVAHQTN